MVVATVDKRDVNRRTFERAGGGHAAEASADDHDFGPAGFVSMEDGVVGGFIQRAAAADPDASTVIPMGGRGIEPSQGSRVTEAAVRGFWKGWRECMGI